jgi:hypothetical protein
MNSMRIQGLIVLGCMLMASGAMAQQYTTAAGIRAGSEIGITLQQHLWNKYSFEAIIQQGFSNRRTTITALMEQHHNILGRGANFYLGAGPHLGLYGQSSKNIEGGSATAFGLSLIGGLELKLGRTLLSLDYKPMFNLAGADRVFEGQTAVSVRYVFLKAQKKPKEKKWQFWKKRSSTEKRSLR